MKKLLMLVALACGLCANATVYKSTIEYTAAGGYGSAIHSHSGSWSSNGNSLPSWVGTPSFVMLGGQITYTFYVSKNTETTSRSCTFVVTLGSSGNTWQITLNQAGAEAVNSFGFVTSAHLKDYTATANWPADMFLCNNSTTAITRFKVGSAPNLYFAWHNTGNQPIVNMPFRVDVMDVSGNVVATSSSELTGTIPAGTCCYKTDFGLTLNAVGTYKVLLTLDPNETKADVDRSDNARLILWIYVYDDPVYAAGSISQISAFPYGSDTTSTILGFSKLAGTNFDQDNYPYTLTCSSIPDAEKTSGTGVDYRWCAQLTDVDLLTYGGYAAAAGFANADALADYLRNNPTIANDGDVISHVLGLGGYSADGARKFLPTTYGNCELLTAFKEGFADGKSLASVGLLFQDGKGNGVIHVLAVCGYMIDTYYAENDPQRLFGIFCIDPDDDKSATPGSAPNCIRYYDLNWNSTYQCYTICRDYSWEGINYSEAMLYCDGANCGYFLKADKKEESAATYTVAFNANGGSGEVAAQTMTVGTAATLSANAFTRNGYSFLGWALSADGAVAYADQASVQDLASSGSVTLYAVWTLLSGTDGVIEAGKAAGTYSTAASFVSTQYSLTTSGLPDWIKSITIKAGKSNIALDASINCSINTSLSGEGVVTVDLAANTGDERSFVWTIPASDGSSSVKITIKQVGASDPDPVPEYTITYVDTKGVGNANPDTYTSAAGVASFKALADTTEYTFNGWTPSSIAAGTVGAVTVTANWTKKSSTDIGTVDGSVANTYDGVLYDSDYGLAGMLQVRLGKAKNGVSKLTATITPASGKKVTVSGSFTIADGTFSGSTKDGRALTVTFGSDGMSGKFGDYTIEGTRNVFSSSASSDKSEASSLMDAYKGSYTLAFADDNGWNGLSVVVGAKGKIKVSGTLATGKKVSASSQLMVSDGAVYAPVVISKNAQLAFVLYWYDGGDTDVVGLSDAFLGTPGTMTNSEFALDVVELLELYSGVDNTEVRDEYLPDGEEIMVSGTKWIVMPDSSGKAMKNGKLVWDKSEGDINSDKSKIDGYNVSGLKLTYSAKTGTFRGSFKIYTVVNNSLKTTTASISGVVVDGVGYGTATVKKVGSVAVEIK